jgi:SulP family sulfate permease
LCTFGLTVLVDLTVAIEVGIVLAAFIFMRRMILVTQTTAITEFFTNGTIDAEDPDATFKKNIPEGVEVFEVNGPFFFGAAEKFKNTLRELKEFPRVLILRMRHVPMIDATGLKALEEIIHKHFHEKTSIILSGVQPEVSRTLRDSGITAMVGEQNIVSDIDQAIRRAEDILHEAILSQLTWGLS